MSARYRIASDEVAEKTSPEPLDVWLRFDDPNDEEAAYDANTYATSWGFTVEWCHTAVGLIRRKDFNTYDEARKWLTSEGFEDFSS